MVRFDAEVCRRKAKRQGYLEILKPAHLPIEPSFGVWSETVGPAQAGPQVAYAHVFHAGYRVFKPGILKMKPLTETDGAVGGEVLRRQLRIAFCIDEAKVIMPVVRGAFRFLVPCFRRPRGRQVKQAVPVDARRLSVQQFKCPAQAEFLNLFRSKGRNAHFRDPDGFAGHFTRLTNAVRPLA